MGGIFADNNPSLTIHANSTGRRKVPISNSFDVVAILVKHLNAIVTCISHQDVVIRVNKEMVGRTELPSTHDPNKIALEIKDLQPIPTILTRHNISIRQKTNTNG